jgi:hypothetical protein
MAYTPLTSYALGDRDLLQFDADDSPDTDSVLSAVSYAPPQATPAPGPERTSHLGEERHAVINLTQWYATGNLAQI